MAPIEVLLALLAAAVVGVLLGGRVRAARRRRPAGPPHAARAPLPGAPSFPANLLDALHDAVYSVSPDRRILTWNAAAERIYGFAPAEVLGRTVNEVFRTEFATGESHDAVYALLDREGHLERQVTQVRRDGARLHLESHAVAVRDAVGTVTGYVIVNRDVTERRHAEEAVRTSEARFRAAFHGAGIAIALLDADGNIVEHNRQFADMVGWSDDELHGRPIGSLLHPDDVARARADLRDAVQNGRDLVVGERRYVRKDGSCVHGLLRSSIIRDAEGRYLHSVGIIEDVTQKRAVEAQLAFADRMASLGTLAAGVAHEINNPLAFILSNLEYVAEEVRQAGSLPADVLQAVEETRHGALRVREIVRDLKTFSRHDDGDDEIVDLAEVLQTSVHLTQNEIRHRSRLALSLGDVPRVRGNPHRLGQVFVNLLINAAQAIAEGEPDANEIEVRTGTDADGRAHVAIRDTGRGIHPENLARIFEPFFTTKPVGVGTGLGLSICHGLVARMGGEIRVESRPGGGSTFHVLLPAATDRPAAAPAREGPRGTAARARLLVVDDEPMVANAVARSLRPAHEVTAVSSARAALDHLERDAFDAIVCDLLMPDMTGMDLHAQLASARPALAGRMIFLTGGAFTPRAREFLERVPNPRLEKPFEPDTLRAAVARLLAGAA